eukprot:2531691-Alexandrium_andersonii.AAC.1
MRVRKLKSEDDSQLVQPPSPRRDAWSMLDAGIFVDVQNVHIGSTRFETIAGSSSRQIGSNLV